MMQAPSGSPAPKAQRGRKQANGMSHPAQSGTPQRSQRQPRQHNNENVNGTQSLSATAHQTPARNQRQSRSSQPAKQPIVNGLDGAGTQSGYTQTSTPVKQMAYAGPTFHASPAPSSLPIPRFFSKSVPSAVSATGLQARLDASPSRAAPSLSPQSGVVTPVRREESPLDLLFNAHRAEQTKNNNGTSKPSLLAYDSAPSFEHDQQMSGKDLFMLELDGAGESSDTVDTTPFRDRMHAARSSVRPPDTSAEAMQDERLRMEKSEALKQLLKVQSPAPAARGLDNFANHNLTPTRNNGPTYGHRPSDFDMDYRHHNRGAPQIECMPQLDNGQTAGQPDVRTMEADLRKLLKLGPG